jgi:hypothetical protein
MYSQFGIFAKLIYFINICYEIFLSVRRIPEKNIPLFEINCILKEKNNISMQPASITTNVVSSNPTRDVLDTTLCDNVCQ